MSLLKTAAEIVGGVDALARHLGIGQTLLAKFMDDLIELPDQLLLRAVDIVLEDRHARLVPPATRVLENPQPSVRG